VSEAQLVSAFAEMTAAADAVVAVLPAQMRTSASPWNEILGNDALKLAAQIEGHRLNRETAPLFFDRVPGTGAVESPHDRYSLPTLSERVGVLASNCRDRFNAFAPSTSPPGLTTTAGALAQVSVDVSHSSAPADTVLPPPVDAEAARALLADDVNEALRQAREEGLL
jgi:hypothetical protein